MCLYNTMNPCVKTGAQTKFVLNVIFGILSMPPSISWKANLLLCAALTYMCHGVIDIPALLLAATHRLESHEWNIAYILYIFGFTYSQGIPILGAVGVLLPFVASGMGRDQHKWNVYRYWSILLSCLIVLQRAK